MLKYSPKSFWGMLKPAKCNNPDVPTAAIADLNRILFFDENIEEEGYRAIVDKQANYISPEELKQTIEHHFSANKSSGLSKLPL
jgi:hypothetical protein